uniref:enolase-phosphatase E1-like isoform X2 n=1 Tax=Myxine glutinosa TaxID=7769 RepID=UPI00358FC9D2
MMIEGKDQGEAAGGAETVVLRRSEKINDCDAEKNYGSHVRRIKSMFLMDERGQTRRPVLAPKPWAPSCRSSIILEASHSGARVNVPAEAHIAPSLLEDRFIDTRKFFETSDVSTQKKDVDTSAESVSKTVSHRPTSLHTTSSHLPVSPENGANSLSNKDEAGRSNVEHPSQMLDLVQTNASIFKFTSANQPITVRAKMGEAAQRETVAEQLEACDSSSPSYNVTSEQPTSPTFASFPKRVRQYSLECPRPFKLQHDAHPVKWAKIDSPVSPGSMRNRWSLAGDASFPALAQLQSSNDVKPVHADQTSPDKLPGASENDDVLRKEPSRGEQEHARTETVEVVTPAEVPKQRSTMLLHQRKIDNQDDLPVEEPLKAASDVRNEGMVEAKTFSNDVQTDKSVTATNEAVVGPTAILPEETSVSPDSKNDLSVDEDHDRPDKVIPEFPVCTPVKVHRVDDAEISRQSLPLEGEGTQEVSVDEDHDRPDKVKPEFPVCTFVKVHRVDDVEISRQSLPLEGEGTQESTSKQDDEEKSEENKKEEEVSHLAGADCPKEEPFQEDKVHGVKDEGVAGESWEIQGKVSSFLEEEDKVSPDDDARTTKESKSFAEEHLNVQPIATPTELEVGVHQKSMASEVVNFRNIDEIQSMDTSLQIPSECHVVEPMSENGNEAKVLKDQECHFPEESATIHDSETPSQKDIILTPNEPSPYVMGKNIFQNEERKTKGVVFDEIPSCKVLDTCHTIEAIVTSDKDLAEAQMTKSEASSSEETEARPEKTTWEDNNEKSEDERRSSTHSDGDMPSPENEQNESHMLTIPEMLEIKGITERRFQKSQHESTEVLYDGSSVQDSDYGEMPRRDVFGESWNISSTDNFLQEEEVTDTLVETETHLRTSLDLQKPSHLENSPSSPGDEQCHEPNDGIKVHKIKEINAVATGDLLHTSPGDEQCQEPNDGIKVQKIEEVNAVPTGDELHTSPENIVLMSPAEDGIDVPTKTVENDISGDVGAHGECPSGGEPEVPSENGDNDPAVEAEKVPRGKEDEEPREAKDASPEDGRTDDGMDDAGVEKGVLEKVVVSAEPECAEKSQEAPDELSEDVETVEAKEKAKDEGERDALISEPENFRQPAPSEKQGEVSGKEDEMSDFVMVLPQTEQLDSTVQKSRAQLIVKSKRQKPSRSHLRKGDSEDDDTSSVPTSPATVTSDQSSQPSRLSPTDASSPCHIPGTPLRSSTADLHASSPGDTKTEEKGATSPQEGTPTGKSRLRFLDFRAQLRKPSRRSVNKESRSSTHGSPRVSREIQDGEGSNGPAQAPSQLTSSSCMPFFFNRKSSLSSTSSNDPPSLNTSPEKRRSKAAMSWPSVFSRSSLEMQVEEVTPETGGAVAVSPGPEVLDWSAEQVGEWLKELEKGQYSAEFVKQAVTGSQLIQLDGNKLKALGVADSNDRAFLKKKIKEIKFAVEKERKAQEKLEKRREKQRRKEEEEQKKTVKATPASGDLDDSK